MGNPSRLRVTLWKSGMALAAAGALATAACGGKNKTDPANPAAMASDTAVPKVDPSLCETAGKEVATFDLNRDNRPDVWKLYKTIEEDNVRAKVLSCKQVDFNHDNKKDYVVAYNNRGAMLYEKYDYDFDEIFDAIVTYDEKSGKIVEVQRDSDFDRKYDVLELYDENGVLKSVRRDRNQDSQPDLWEQFEGGDPVAILYDDDFDGKVDRRQQIKAKKTEMPQPPPGTEVEPEPDSAEEEAGEPAEDGADS